MGMKKKTWHSLWSVLGPYVGSLSSPQITAAQSPKPILKSQY